MEEPRRKLGPYTLIKKIGRGAFGVVWLAEKQTAIATTSFALKLSRDEDIDLEAFKQEAAIWVQASGHPNVVTLIEADIYDEQVVLVSEYLPDGSLANWLKQHGGKAPSIESACEMIDGVLAGLAHLHERRIIHRDLKPDNILLRRDAPRLADFGIARLLRTGSYSTNISGTLAYMAPEAFDGKRNEQTDIWAVGVILYQLLAGCLPYSQSDTVSLIGAIMRLDPPPLSESVPDAFRHITMKALQRDPVERYAAATEMRNAIREAGRRLWLQEHDAREVRPTHDEDLVATVQISEFQETRMPPVEGSRATYQGNSENTAGTGLPLTIAASPPVTTHSEPKPAKTIKAQHPQPFTPNEAHEPALATRGGATRRGKTWIAIASAIVVAAVTLAIWAIKAQNQAAQAEQARQEEARKAFDNRSYDPSVLLKQPTPGTNQSVTAPSLENSTPSTVKNALGMEFVPIPAGSFMMGSENGHASEKPVHRVTISKPFYLAKTEVTQAQWLAVMGNSPFHFKGDNLPAEQVSWDDAQEFIRKLNQMNDGFTYRLPTEAEWEYACRAGTTGDYAGRLDAIAWYGNNSGQQYLNAAEIFHTDKSNYGNRLAANGNQTHPVGTKQPNTFGLYDMAGNVWEWCQDWYDETYYRNSPPADPQGPESGEYRVLRGGSWYYLAIDLRSAVRVRLASDSSLDVGFRVAGVRTQ